MDDSAEYFRVARDPYDYRQNSRPKLGFRANTYSGNTKQLEAFQRGDAYSFVPNSSMNAVPPNFFSQLASRPAVANL